ncbi:ArsB/NhaD family transporter [Patescibacteria group bacterium]|nr:ArsB/NhaD family transporter [Patescibacteria group bacterium]MBU1673910.1 ArsB/NhaD family transporter [Patescibacteria group bacterium]MBU1963904.1 ArsB/NhaD family transporter [Patescibacteria group bacterium]
MIEEVVHNEVTTAAVIAALLIFLASYGLIISEKVHRTIVSLIGASIIIIAGIFLQFYDQHQAINAIDFNTIGLLIGMMIIVEIVKHTGLFQYIAIKAAKKVKGRPWPIMLIFAVITAVFSALLDNVTTVLLLVPITMVICDNLHVNPKPFLLVVVFSSNIGGTATLIGDPPNILIGSAAGLSFMDFVKNLGPVVVLMFLAIIPFFYWRYHKRIQTDQKYMDNIMELKEKESIKDKKLLKKSLVVLGLVMLGFIFHGALGLEAATIAIFGAGLLLLLENKNLEKALHGVEWTTIFFFVGLFVLVGGLENTGVLSWLAEQILLFTQGNLAVTSTVILWGSAFISAFVDNIPFVATMIPLVQDMGGTFSNLNPLWWSLALGACLGGNGALVGASANLVVAGMSEKAGYKITFVEFMKTGLVIMIITVAISNIYLWLRYW